MTKDELLAEAALILEQKGLLIGRIIHEIGSRPTTRLSRFNDRYKEWQEKVVQFREINADAWSVPPDNS